ncbi:MAG: ATPase, partial [Nitrososphaerales archaeon]
TIEKQSGPWLRKPQKCIHCEETHNLDIDPTSSTFIDFQVLKMQELPEDLPPGQLPQASDAYLLGDLVNAARPGDRATITGIIRAEPEQSQAGRSRVFHSHIESNYVEILGKEPESILLAKEDVDKIRTLLSQPGAYERLIRSMAPGIHGFETQKEAVLLLSVGSPRTTMPDGSMLRGDINILLVGDPGTAKSELLKYASRIAPRGLYTSEEEVRQQG